MTIKFVERSNGTAEPNISVEQNGERIGYAGKRSDGEWYASNAERVTHGFGSRKEAVDHVVKTSK